MKRVIFVDDSKTMLMLSGASVKKYVESGEIDILQYENPLELLEDIKNNSVDFDLLVTDINMPEMDGFTLVENIKQFVGDDKKFIALTTEGTKKKEEMIKKLGFSGWVMKPFKIETLGNAIEKVLGL